MSSMLVSIAIVVQIISAVAVIILVLLQHGKGADLGAAFGSGASGSIFLRQWRERFHFRRFGLCELPVSLHGCGCHALFLGYHRFDFGFRGVQTNRRTRLWSLGIRRTIAIC